MGKATVVTKRVLFWAMLSLYVLMLSLIIVSIIVELKSLADNRHIIVSTLLGLAVTFLPLFMRKVMKIEVSLLVIIFGYTMILLNTMGEVFDLYYRFQNWDIALHTFGGYGFAFLTFGAFYSVHAPRGISQTAIYLLGSIAISISISAVWEVMEYGADMLFGTNMLKAIPENHLFNGGSTKDLLLGTDTEIAEFYRSPNGYMYAVVDTMMDLICAIGGAMAFSIIYLLTGKRHPLLYKETFVKVDKVS
jgi:hypothetical protein